MENLKKLRKQYNLSQQNLADILHISQQSVWKYENDIATPDLETLTNMANYFNTSIDYIIGHSDVPHRIEFLTDTMLNEDELVFIKYYRQLSEKQKDAIKAMMECCNE